MKLFTKIKNKIDAQPIEEIRESMKKEVPLNFFPSIYALIVVLINIGLALIAAFNPGDVSEITDIVLGIFAVIPKSAILVCAFNLIYYLFMNNFFKICIYPRIRQDIRENPELQTKYELKTETTPWEAIFCVIVLLVIDAAIFSLPVFAEYESVFLIYFNVSLTLPTVSYFCTKWIWPLQFKKAIKRIE